MVSQLVAVLERRPAVFFEPFLCATILDAHGPLSASAVPDVMRFHPRTLHLHRAQAEGARGRFARAQMRGNSGADDGVRVLEQLRRPRRHADARRTLRR